MSGCSNTVHIANIALGTLSFVTWRIFFGRLWQSVCIEDFHIAFIDKTLNPCCTVWKIHVCWLINSGDFTRTRCLCFTTSSTSSSRATVIHVLAMITNLGSTSLPMRTRTESFGGISRGQCPGQHLKYLLLLNLVFFVAECPNASCSMSYFGWPFCSVNIHHSDCDVPSSFTLRCQPSLGYECLGRFGNGNLGKDKLLMCLCPLDALQSWVLCKFGNHT